MFFLNKMFKYKVFVSIFILIGVLNVVCSQEENYVYDQTGRTVAVETRCTTSLRQDINTSSLHAGIYILKVVTDNGIETAKFVKK